ncbi:response regulator transcription factor [Streptomyces sp. NPDC057236]|uniref:response regulator transcription factor n=1 Tax=Streptomyces sp. NPDC057236 TaxID=3346059 RepID=UPI003645A5A0
MALSESSGSDRRQQVNHALATPLAPRETNVLHPPATGLTAEVIGRRPGIPPRTVHKHLNALYRKLGAADRLSTVPRAQDAGLLPGPARPSGAHPGPGSTGSRSRWTGSPCPPASRSPPAGTVAHA